MKNIEIYSLPVLHFAHMYKADSYGNRLAAQKDRIEISYIAEGEALITVPEGSFHLEKGDIICNLCDSVLEISAPSFHCHHTVCAGLKWTQQEKEKEGLLLPVVIRASENTAEIYQIIDDFIYKPHLYEESAARTSAQFLQLLCKIDACQRKAAEKRIPGEILLAQKARKYIHQHIYEPITQTRIAEHLNISSGYLCHIFKKTQGTTVMRYVNRAKLEGIRDLMEKKHICLYEAAALYGYRDVNYVSALHKKMFGYNITDKPTVTQPVSSRF